ncbi:MAG TPA: hypothetical protein VEU51_01575 [Candidatus Acidoferrales bacterium]|nr:hypothetical protein [Candidatus Acidoferrales bacterium]
MTNTLSGVLRKLDWMREQRIWPNGKRYLWTDAFGVTLLVSLYRELGRKEFLERAESVVADVERVLGRRRGLRIGEAPDRDGQYFHYLAMWIFALSRLGAIIPEYRTKAISIVKAIHNAFVIPGRGVIWKMQEDLSAPYPGYGLGALDSFHGYVVYRSLDNTALADEIAQMKLIVERTYQDLNIEQDLGLGMMLWMTRFFPEERWARVQRERSLAMLDRMWVDPPGYFCREPGAPSVKFAFTNYGVALGLQAVDSWPERVARVNSFFEEYRSNDEYDTDAITHVMACVSAFPGEFIL